MRLCNLQFKVARIYFDIKAFKACFQNLSMGACGTKIQLETNHTVNTTTTDVTQQTAEMLDLVDHEQTTLFNGYIRMEIVNHLTDYSLVPEDVINLCMKFYYINIKESIHNYDDIRTVLTSLNHILTECFKNKEYFIAYKTGQLLTSLDPTTAIHHANLRDVSSEYQLLKLIKQQYVRWMQIMMRFTIIWIFIIFDGRLSRSNEVTEDCIEYK